MAGSEKEPAPDLFIPAASRPASNSRMAREAWRAASVLEAWRRIEKPAPARRDPSEEAAAGKEEMPCS